MTKTFTKNNETFSIIVIENKKDLKDNQDVIDLLDKLAIEAFEDHNKKLEAEGGKVINMPAKENLWKPSNEWISNAFKEGENRKIFAIKNSKNEAVQTVIALFDNKTNRERINIDNNVGTFIYLTSIVTSEKYKGQGFLGQMFNKILTYAENPKRNYQKPIQFATSITQTACETKLGTINDVINLDIYSAMWQDRLINNKLQVRFQDLDNANNQYGKEIFDLKDFLIDKKIDKLKVSELVESKKDEASKQNQFVRGFYLIGDQPRTYIELKEFKQIKQQQFLNK